MQACPERVEGGQVGGNQREQRAIIKVSVPETPNDLAGTYNNRAGALSAKDEFEAAMADSMAALDLMNQLVHQEGRSELTGSLARYLGMRGGILRAADSHDEAWDSFAAGAQLLEPMVQGGRGDLLPLLLGAVGDLASEAPEARKEKETAERANTALGLLKQAVDAGHVTEVLREAGKAFCADIGAHMGPLAEAGLDVETFIEVAKQLGILDDVADDPASGD